MPTSALTVAAALLLAAGCTAHRAQARQAVTVQPERTVTVSAGPTATSTSTASSSPAPSTTAAAPGSRAQSSTPAPSGSTMPVGISTTAPAPRTRQIVRRPVTGTGRAARGYTTRVLPAAYQLNCGGNSRFASPSSVSVDAGPVSCGPSVAYAVACWNGPTPTTALCYQDPWHHQVVQLHTQGRLPAEPAPQQPSPLGLLLQNGTRCSLREGGAWSELDNHPELFGTYSCTGPDVVWAVRHSDGIDRSGRLWKVWLAPMSGHGKLYSMTVRTAYFVGTARS